MKKRIQFFRNQFLCNSLPTEPLVKSSEKSIFFSVCSLLLSLLLTACIQADFSKDFPFDKIEPVLDGSIDKDYTLPLEDYSSFCIVPWPFSIKTYLETQNYSFTGNENIHPPENGFGIVVTKNREKWDSMIYENTRQGVFIEVGSKAYGCFDFDKKNIQFRKTFSKYTDATWLTLKIIDN